MINWYLLGMEISLGHAHKTRFWFLLGGLSKFSDEHPRHFYRGVPEHQIRFVYPLTEAAI